MGQERVRLFDAHCTVSCSLHLTPSLGIFPTSLLKWLHSIPWTDALVFIQPVPYQWEFDYKDRSSVSGSVKAINTWGDDMLDKSHPLKCNSNFKNNNLNSLGILNSFINFKSFECLLYSMRKLLLLPHILIREMKPFLSLEVFWQNFWKQERKGL